MLLLAGLVTPILTCAWIGVDGRCDLSIVLEEEGRAVPGLIRFEDARGGAVAPGGLLSRGLGLEEKHPALRWSVLPGPSQARLAREKLVVQAFHGLETELSRAEIDLTDREQAELRIPLKRFANEREKGWTGANTHLHLKEISREESDRYLGEVPRADGLDALFVSYLERTDADRGYISNRYTEADLQALTGRTGVLFGNGEEHRHNFTGFGEGFGHVMFLNIRALIHPVSIGPGIMKKGTDGLPLQKGIDEARRDGATVLWCHNTFGLEDIPNWVTGRPHAQNIFDGDPATHGNYKDTFYRYLNAGLRVPFSTGTDWFIYDFSRVYAAVREPRGPRDWLGVLEAGRTFITNGPLLELDVAGETPGGTVRLEKAGRVRFKIRAAGRVDFGRIELIRNADVVAKAGSRAEEGHFTAAMEGELEIPGPCWIALRMPPPPTKEEPNEKHPVTELGGPLFAHTSAVQVEVAGNRVFDAEAVKGLLEEVRQSRATIEKIAVFADEHERGHVLGVYAVAIRVLEGLLKR